MTENQNVGKDQQIDRLQDDRPVRTGDADEATAAIPCADSSDDSAATIPSPVSNEATVSIAAAKGVVAVDTDESIDSGHVLGGRYRVISVLGRGGMGVVYRVEQIFLSKHFALKTLKVGGASDAAVKRFQVEARACSGLDHPNLVQVHDFGLLDDGTPFFVMDLIEGKSLSEMLKERGSLPWSEALPIFIKACFGLSHAHEKGVIHRDIKPSNILIGRDHEEKIDIKIVDFGIAKLAQSVHGEMQTLTQTGEVFGSPYYMSPEQCMGTAIDQRTDIYSLGCVIFEALTGAPPFIGENALATMMKHRAEAALSLKQASLGQDFPPQLEQIVEKMLQKEPQDRFDRASTVAQALMFLTSSDGEDTHTATGIAETFSSSPPKSQLTMPASVTISVPALAILLVFVAGFCFVAGMLFDGWRFAQNQSTGAVPVQQPLPSVLPDRKDIPSAGGKRVTSRIVKVDGTEMREFTFPPDSGELYAVGFAYPSSRAEGKRSFPATVPVGYKVNKLIIHDNPDYLIKLKPDDLDTIEFPEDPLEIVATDPVFIRIGHLKGLRCVRLSNTNANDAWIPELNQLPHLKILFTDDTGIRSLSKLTCLKEITDLHCSGVADHKQLLKKLIDSKHLISLHLRKSGLTDDDMDTISRMTGLQQLIISFNLDITDDGIRRIARMKLTHLNIKDTSVTAGAIEVLARMRTLKEISVPKSWSNEDIARLKASSTAKNLNVKKVRNREDEV